MSRLKIWEALSKMTIKGVIHAGGNIGQEVNRYRKIGVKRLLYFEPMPDEYKVLSSKLRWPNEQAYMFAISDEVGTMKFHRTDNSISSSLLTPKEVMQHQKLSTIEEIEVVAITLDKFFECTPHKPEDYNVLSLDIEGAESRALYGASDVIEHIDAVFTEVNHVENFEGCMLKPRFDILMRELGFVEVGHKWGDRTRTYGNCLYVRE